MTGRWRRGRLLTWTLLLALVVVVGPHPEGSPRAATPRLSAAPAAAVPSLPGVRILHEHVAFTDLALRQPPPFPIAAQAGILVDLDQRRILWQKDAHRPLPEASTTKVMTALVVLENASPEDVLTVPPGAVHVQVDETQIGLVGGQRWTVAQLLAGMLLASGNDAADTLAMATLGADRFLAAMNAQESELGLTDSTFVSPVGLDHPAHRASAYDLAAITAVDVEHFETFRGIVAQRSVEVPGTETHPDQTFWNLNALLPIYPRAVGVKPGLTADSGPCLIGEAIRDGHHLVAVVLDDARPATTSRLLLDWGFTQLGLPTEYPTPKPSPSPSPKPRR